jgi:hypothetical protein
MAKDIVLLDIQQVMGGIVQIRCVFWFAVTNGYPQPNAVSSYPAINTTDPAVLASIQAGTTVEEVITLQFPTSTIVNSWSTVELIIAAFYNERKNYRAGTVAAIPDPGLRYKTYHDSATGWSA